jgi:hypothetical protein
VQAKGEEKVKRSNLKLIQLTKRKNFTKNNKKRLKIISNLPTSTNQSQKRLKNLISLLACKGIRENTKLNNSPKDIITTENPALVDSNYQTI